MTVTITPDEATDLADITRPNFAINQTVSASATATAPNVANVTNVTATLQSGSEPDLVITDGTTSVNIGGTLQDPFVDEFTYIDEGQSDKTQTPVTVQRVVNMPADKLMYNLNQDTTEYTSRFFTRKEPTRILCSILIEVIHQLVSGHVNHPLHCNWCLCLI